MYVKSTAAGVKCKGTVTLLNNSTIENKTPFSDIKFSSKFKRNIKKSNPLVHILHSEHSNLI